MKKYLIDANLPRYFSLWSGKEFQHVVQINDEMVALQNGGLLIKPVDSIPALHSLLEGTSQEDYVLTNEERWMQSGPTGKEVL